MVKTVLIRALNVDFMSKLIDILIKKKTRLLPSENLNAQLVLENQEKLEN